MATKTTHDLTAQITFLTRALEEERQGS